MLCRLANINNQSISALFFGILLWYIFSPFLWNWIVFLVSKATYFLWHPIFSMAPKLQNVPWPIFSFQCSFTCKAEELRACVLIFSLIEAAFLIFFYLPQAAFSSLIGGPNFDFGMMCFIQFESWQDLGLPRHYVYGVKLLSIDCFLGALFYCPSISWNVLGLNHHNLNCLDTNSLSNCYWQRKHKEICSDSGYRSLYFFSLLLFWH